MKFKIYVAGWYFLEFREFYRTLYKIRDHVIVGSHGIVPPQIRKNFKWKEYENIGHGWGLFEQMRVDAEFSELEAQDFVIFMHDDAIVLREDFPQALAKLLETNKCAGNSIERPKYHNFDSIRGDKEFAKGDWYERAAQIPDFKYQIVDGRCFAITPQTLREVRGMEDTYWGTVPRMSNSSLRLFSAKMATFYGPDCHGFLSSEWRNSEYLMEEKAPDSFYSRLYRGSRAKLAKIRALVDPSL